MPCCDHTNNVQCQSRCRQVLRTMTVEEEIVDELITACGSPDLVVNTMYILCAIRASIDKSGSWQLLDII